MIKHLLYMSRFQSQSGTILYKDIDALEIVDFIKGEVETEMKRKSISLILQIPKNSILTLDEDIAKEILRNAIINSIKFSRENTEIIVTYREDNGFQILTIQDQGIGISKEKVQMLQGHVYFSTAGTN
jgi:two-component system, sensor histidine kinase and response regulator